MKTNFKDLTISSVFKGDKKVPWGTTDNWNNHKITVKNNVTGKKVSFEFWASIAKPDINEEDDLKSALSCFLNDGFYADNFEDFCSNFGYDNDSIKALKLFKACQRQSAKAFKILTYNEIESYINELSKLGL